MCECIAVHETIGSTRIVHLFDEIDIANAASFESELEGLDLARRVIIELSNCRYLDAAGLSVLVRAFKRYGKQLAIVVQRAGNVVRIVQLAGLHEILPLFDSLDLALHGGLAEAS